MALLSSVSELRACLQSAGLACEQLDEVFETMRYVPGDDFTVNKLLTALYLTQLCDGCPPVEETLSRSVVVASGSVAAGTRAIVFAKVGDTGTVNIEGVELFDTRPLHLTARDCNTLPLVNYTISGGASLEINTLTE